MTQRGLFRTLIPPVALGVLIGFGLLAPAYPFIVLRLAYILLTHKS